MFKQAPYIFNKTCPRILHIGTAWNKNTERVIHALQDITCKLIIIGEATDSILSILNENGIDYELLCNLSNEELYQQYQLADIISFPSIFEGFGMPIIEGQATGRPILTSNIAPMTEVAGEGACFVNPHNINSIRNGFLKIINDSTYRDLLISKGNENVKRFSLEHITKQYKQLYINIHENSF
jgi:glycosyltransferase involved in cell wall biosynthesis